MSAYVAPLRDMRFVLKELAGLAEVAKLPGYGEADADTVGAICADGPSVVNLLGKTSILQVAALARRARGVVGNDTGPIHITASVGAPTLVVMSGQTDPVRMIPRGPDVGYVRENDLADLPVKRVLAAIRLRAC